MNRSNPIKSETVARVIDHMLLEPSLTEQETIRGCLLALSYQVASVTVKPCFVRQAVTLLKGTAVAVGTVIGFPHGSNTTYIKLAEAKRALTEGAIELELVINIGYLREGKEELVRADIQSICGLAHMNGALVKVILESSMLTEENIRLASRIAANAGADWISTSTNFPPSGTDLRDIGLIKDVVGEIVQLKAMANVHSLSELHAFLKAGCTRVGLVGTEEIFNTIMP